MKNKFNLDLSFLYQEPLIRDYYVAGIDKEYEAWKNKYENEKNEFRKFSEESKLEDFVYMFVIAFRDTFPNVISLSYFFCGESVKETETRTSHEEYFRDDIEYFATEMLIGPLKDDESDLNRDNYEKEVIINFKENIPEKIIKKALEDISYEKTVEGEKTIYSIDGSPIDRLEVTDKGLTLLINPEKVILYYKL